MRGAAARELDVQLLPGGGADTEEGSPASAARAAELTPAAACALRGSLFSWVKPLLRRAQTAERLETTDLFSVPQHAHPDPLYQTFITKWRESFQRTPASKRKPTGRLLMWVLFRVHFSSMWILWAGALAESLLNFAKPVLLNVLVTFVKDEDGPLALGLLYAVLLFLSQAVVIVLDNVYNLGLDNLGLRIRATLITAVFRKVITLRQDSMQRFSTGKLNNLISTDVDKPKNVLKYVHNLIAAPIQVTICVFSLYKLVGVSVFVGFAYMGFVILLNPVMMYVCSLLEDKQQSKTDERVRQATETINAIQVVKCYAWEEPAVAKVEEARRVELRAMWHLYCFYTVFECLYSSIEPVTIAVMFAAYALLNPDSPLTAAQAFTAMSLLEMVKEPLFVLPWVLNLIVEAVVAAKRMERLFFLPETKLQSIAFVGSFLEGTSSAPAADAAESTSLVDTSAQSTLAVNFEGETFVWPSTPAGEEEGDEEDDDEEEDSTENNDGPTSHASDSQNEPAAAEVAAAPSAASSGEAAATTPATSAASATSGASASGASASASSVAFRLLDLRLQVPQGALVAVVGATGSGKTSLLQAILGEMPEAAVVAAEEPSELSSSLSSTVTAAPGDIRLQVMAARSAAVQRGRALAFTPQQAWVSNATVRNNILFGETFDEKRYAECLRCCDLEKDLESLKKGDLTKVGEKGISLSGGQKARICLARAAYKCNSSNIFLLDDPYSALDAHVARKVHENAVKGLLAKKTRILVTNRLEFISDCHLVVVLDAGRVDAVGSYDDVRRRSEPLRTLLAAQGLENLSSPEAESVAAVNPVLVRQLSYDSVISGEDENETAQQNPPDAADDDEDEEGRATGQLKAAVVGFYLTQMGGPPTVTVLASLYILSEALQLALPIWLAVWTAAKPAHDELFLYLSVYVGLSVALILFMTFRDLFGNIVSFRAARRLHRGMFEAVLRAPMSFFQDTPQGRIINRFSKDMSEIDKELIWQMIYTLVPVLSVVGNFAMVAGTAYFALMAFLPAFWLYYLLWKYYNRAAIELKRLTKTTSSPVYDHFNNLCRENAITIVRAHKQVERQCRLNERLLSEQQRPEYSLNYAEKWFSMRVAHLGCCLILFVSVFVVLGRGRLVTDSTAALALTFAGGFSDGIGYMIGQLAEFGIAFNCVERVMEYSTTLPSEAPALTDSRPPPQWPEKGELEIENLRLRYRPELPLVLHGLSFTTKAGERLGIVGRTGAGKSSLLLGLLRIAEPEPDSIVRLDGQDLLKLGLHDVRSKISIIPQEPVLFQETLRYNCDPFGRHSSAEVWAALEEAQLAPWVRQRALGNASQSTSGDSDSGGAAAASTSLPPPSASELETLMKLDIKEGGQNLSVGQRQMVAIARAVLRKSCLVVLDEATAAIDAATDACIQLAVRRCFHGATTLTIAHRLQTILDSDRVLVLEQGQVAELGPPEDLLAKEDGIFKSMVSESTMQF
eukprot:TRINITY_DN37162_c0_g1_i1.p1 TRINITY_DN37162_c0_g1~~TRINITY_DN37162_c0_g1_i1.p1  ORF type:complete len:1471 (-),score=333.19 TRINITY_DN37162_c0_g1_i1:289-4701(-)